MGRLEEFYIKIAHWYGPTVHARWKTKLEKPLNRMTLRPSLVLNWNIRKRILFTLKRYGRTLSNYNYKLFTSYMLTSKLSSTSSLQLISKYCIKYVKNSYFVVSHCVKSQFISDLSYCLSIIHIDIYKSYCLTTYI